MGKRLVGWILIALLLVGFAFYRQEEISARQNQIISSLCISIQLNNKTLQFVTLPADLTGLVPPRLESIEKLNVRRAKFRDELSKSYAKVLCN